MKQKFFYCLVILFVLAVGSQFAQDKMMKKEGKKSMDKEMTIKGEVVDVACYLHVGDKAKGEDHLSCAQACAKAGGALGILTDKGELYVSMLPDDHSAGPNAILMDHISHKVEATGMVRSKGGVRGIMLTKVEMAKEAEKSDK